MDLIGFINHHGYQVCAAGLFLAAMGLPLPASTLLLMAGAAAHAGGLNLWGVLSASWIGALAATHFSFSAAATPAGGFLPYSVVPR